MKKRLVLILAIIVSVFAFNVYAETNSVKLTGKNTFGRELIASLTCEDTYKYVNKCNAKIQWFISNTNSTSGGTEVNKSDTENRYYENYIIERSYIGKYIYVVVTFMDPNGVAQDVVVKDVTDATNNGSATVTDYITYDNTTEYTISATATTGVVSSLTMQLNGITDTDSDYFIWFTDAGELSLEQTNSGCSYNSTDSSNINSFKLVSSRTGEISISDDWNILNGYTSAYVIKRTKDSVNGGYYCTITQNSITITRPALPTLGNRYKFYLFTDDYDHSLTTFPLFPYMGSNGDHKIVTKIGKINDSALIKKLAKQQTGALDELLTYAKNNAGTTFTYTDEHYNDNDIGSFNVTNGAYYFIYTTYQNRDGLYRDLDDVTVVQGYAGMLVNDVNWPDDDEVDVNWNAFVNRVKSIIKSDEEGITVVQDNENGLIVDYVSEEEKTYRITVTNTENSLKMIITAENYSYTYIVNYENGIIVFDKENESNEVDANLNWTLNTFVIAAFVKTKGYDGEKVMTYFSTLPEDITVEKDGIEMSFDKYNNEDYFKSLKLDLKNGLKNYKETSNDDGSGKVNPSTGAVIPTIMGLSLMTAVGTIIVIKNKKKMFI